MKVKILKKSIKEGVTSTGSEYCIKSLFVSFQEPEVYEKIVKHLKALNISNETIEKFCKPNEYNGQVSYCFGLNCSNYTFDRVEKFGILDANIVFTQNERGFLTAKIQVIDKAEQINSYKEPEEEVNRWSSGAEPAKPIKEPEAANPLPVFNPEEDTLNSLPF